MRWFRGLPGFVLLAASFALAQSPAPLAKPSAAIPARNILLHFDPAGTQIKFRVGSMLRDVRGTFQLKTGELAVDPDSTLAQGQLLVDATTGRTGNSAMDKQMQDDILESGRYPSIFFHAEHLRGQLPKTDGESNVIVEGMMNIHGADHPMTLHVHVVRQGDSFTATTGFTVAYVQWGMKEARGTFLHLSKQAHVDVSAKGTIRSVATTNVPQSEDSDEEKPH